MNWSKKIKKNKIVLMLMVLVAVFMTGCSSNEPGITDVVVENLKYDSDNNRIDWYFNVKYAMDEKPKTITSGILKVTFDEDKFTKETEWGFLPGQQNNNNKIGFGWTDYILGEKITGKVEMIQGTKVISTKKFEVVYNK